MTKSVRRGRPSSYREEYAERAYELSLLGLTEDRLAEQFGVSIVTIHNWKKRYPDFLSSLKKGKSEADAKVARSLFERACGSSHPATKIFLVKDEQGNNVPYRIPYVEHHPPDTGAAFIWLKNRQPELWRDRKDVAVTGPGGGPIQVQLITSRVIDVDYADITDAIVETPIGDEGERQPRADNAPRLPAVVSTKEI